MLEVLFDRSVCADARIASTRTVPVFGMENRRLVLVARNQNQEVWHRNEIECLPTIASLIRLNEIQMCIDDIGREEYYQSPGSLGTARFGGDLFEGLPQIGVRSAINWHIFHHANIRSTEKIKFSLIEFCEYLVKYPVEETAEKLLGLVPDRDIIGLREVARFRTICKKLSSKHYDDAFQVWGAERNGIPYFLSTNRNFIRAVRNVPGIQLACAPVLPSELLKFIKKTPTISMPFEYGKTYLLNGTLDPWLN